jgi:hypothetical protein
VFFVPVGARGVFSLINGNQVGETHKLKVSQKHDEDQGGMSESRGERRQSLGESRDEPPSDPRAENIHPMLDFYTARSSCPPCLASYSACDHLARMPVLPSDVVCFVLDASRDSHPPPSELLAVAVWSRALHDVFSSDQHLMILCADRGTASLQARPPTRWRSWMIPATDQRWRACNNNVCAHPSDIFPPCSGLLAFCASAPARALESSTAEHTCAFLTALVQRRECSAGAAAKFSDVLAWAGEGDLGKFFRLVVPEASRIFAPVVEKYGFPATQDGEFVLSSNVPRDTCCHDLLLCCACLSFPCCSAARMHVMYVCMFMYV